MNTLALLEDELDMQYRRKSKYSSDIEVAVNEMDEIIYNYDICQWCHCGVGEPMEDEYYSIKNNLSTLKGILDIILESIEALENKITEEKDLLLILEGKY